MKKKGVETRNLHIKIGAKRWKTLISVFNAVAKQVQVICKQDSFVFRALDPSHVMMIALEIPADSLDEYETGEMVFSLDLKDIDKISQMAHINDSVTVNYSTDSNKMHFHFEGGVGRKAVNVNLIHPNLESVPTAPEMEYKASVIIPLVLFGEILRDVELLSPHITLEAKGDNLYVLASEIGGSDLSLMYSAADLNEFDVTEDAKATYTLEYLKSLFKLRSIVNEVRMKFSEDKPLCLEFPLIDGGIVTALLAPRLEPDFRSAGNSGPTGRRRRDRECFGVQDRPGSQITLD